MRPCEAEYRFNILQDVKRSNVRKPPKQNEPTSGISENDYRAAEGSIWQLPLKPFLETAGVGGSEVSCREVVTRLFNLVERGASPREVKPEANG
ncbi:MAG: hypothetical protein Q8O86_13645 [Dehalococcoidia bacterium]|nr:hypothetical protein [Dehalococcoidia bacterium]